MRPDINLKRLNTFVQYLHFKMENINSLIDLLRPNDFIANIDLKDAYFTVPIHADQSKFLRFYWEGVLYEFIVLPFGLASAPRVFTKLMKPIIAYLRGKSVRLIIFLDDIAVLGNSFADCSQNVLTVIQVLEEMGFIVNTEKSCLVPKQVATYIGYLLDTRQMKISLPEEKLAKISMFATDLLTRKACLIRELARLTGMIVSSFRAVLPSKLHYRSLERLKIASLASNNNDYNKSALLNAEARSDLNWWAIHASHNNGAFLQKSSDVVTITTDASRSGWGAHCHDLHTQGLWSADELGRHINYLELLAVLFALKSFIRSDRRKFVRVYSDNTTAVTYINNMSGMIPLLDFLSRQIWQWCLDRNCEIESFHLPGHRNYCADFLSRAPCCRLEWKLNTAIFQQICAKVSFICLTLICLLHVSTPNYSVLCPGSQIRTPGSIMLFLNHGWGLSLMFFHPLVC